MNFRFILHICYILGAKLKPVNQEDLERPKFDDSRNATMDLIKKGGFKLRPVAEAVASTKSKSDNDLFSKLNNALEQMRRDNLTDSDTQSVTDEECDSDF